MQIFSFFKKNRNFSYPALICTPPNLHNQRHSSRAGFPLLSPDPLLSFRRKSQGRGSTCQKFPQGGGLACPLSGSKGPKSKPRAPFQKNFGKFSKKWPKNAIKLRHFFILLLLVPSYNVSQHLELVSRHYKIMISICANWQNLQLPRSLHHISL